MSIAKKGSTCTRVATTVLEQLAEYGLSILVSRETATIQVQLYDFVGLLGFWFELFMCHFDTITKRVVKRAGWGYDTEGLIVGHTGTANQITFRRVILSKTTKRLWLWHLVLDTHTHVMSCVVCV